MLPLDLLQFSMGMTLPPAGADHFQEVVYIVPRGFFCFGWLFCINFFFLVYFTIIFSEISIEQNYRIGEVHSWLCLMTCKSQFFAKLFKLKEQLLH